MAWLSLFLFLLMLGIIFFQTIHGGFSAIIMATICLLAGTVAIGLHEPLAQGFMYERLGDFSYPLSFAVLFGGTVIIGRVMLDKLISRNTLLPGIVDKAIATLGGIVTGFVSVGVMGLTAQMIPFGPSILGFQRIDDEGKVHGLWLAPDWFTLKVCGYLADHSLGVSDTKESFFDSHPAFLDDLHRYRNVATTASRITVPPGSVSLTGQMGRTTQLYETNVQELRRGTRTDVDSVTGPPGGTEWVTIGVRLSADAADSDGYYRASPTQVRLVGTDSSGDLTQLPVKAFGAESHVIVENHPAWGNKTGQFDLVFEIPNGFKAKFLEYKRGGRVDVSIGANLDTNVLPAPIDERARARMRNNPQPATRPLAATTSHFGDDLPAVDGESPSFKRYVGRPTLSGSKIRSGRVSLIVDKQGAPPTNNRNQNDGFDPETEEITGFVVPEGVRLLQLNVEAVHAKTELAGAVNLTRRVLQQYRITDKGGQAYFPAGLIAECKSDEGRVMEIQYFPDEYLETFGNQLKKFDRIEFEELKDDYRFVLLFLVRPGAEIVEFDTGNAPVDITDLALTAPE